MMLCAALFREAVSRANRLRDGGRIAGDLERDSRQLADA